MGYEDVMWAVVVYLLGLLLLVPISVVVLPRLLAFLGKRLPAVNPGDHLDEVMAQLRGGLARFDAAVGSSRKATQGSLGEGSPVRERHPSRTDLESAFFGPLLEMRLGDIPERFCLSEEMAQAAVTRVNAGLDSDPGSAGGLKHCTWQRLQIYVSSLPSFSEGALRALLFLWREFFPLDLALRGGSIEFCFIAGRLDEGRAKEVVRKARSPRDE